MFAHRIIHGGHPTHICSVAPFFPPTVLVCSFPAIRPIRGQLTPTQSSLPVLWHCKQNLQGRLWAQQSSTAHNTAQNKSLVRRYAAFSKADTKACRFRSHRTVLTSQRQVPTSWCKHLAANMTVCIMIKVNWYAVGTGFLLLAVKGQHLLQTIVQHLVTH